MDGRSTRNKSEETFADKQASPGLYAARDGFTEGGTLVRDLERGLHPWLAVLLLLSTKAPLEVFKQKNFLIQALPPSSSDYHHFPAM